MKVGILTIGQSPRVDVIPEIRDVLGPDVEIVEKGALDGLDSEDVRKFYPDPNDYILVTRMKDGTEVKVALRSIIERMGKCVWDFQEAVDVIVLLCTGEFPEIESKKIILRLDRVILHMTQSLLGKGRLGVVVPSPDQTELKKKWERTRLEVVTEAVSPYTGTDEELREKAHRIKTADVDLVVLDCIGFSKRTKSIFREITGKPVLLPRTVIARIAREMVEV
jgi:protein AroM